MPGAVLNEALGGPFEGSPPRVLFGLFTMPIPALELDGLAPAPAVDVKLPVATVEQSWGIVPAEDGGLRLRVKYSTELFDADTVRSWMRHYLDLLGLVLADHRLSTGRGPMNVASFSHALIHLSGPALTRLSPPGEDRDWENPVANRIQSHPLEHIRRIRDRHAATPARERHGYVQLVSMLIPRSSMRHKGIVSTAHPRWLESTCLAVLVPAMAFGLAACSSSVAGTSTAAPTGGTSPAATPPSATSKSSSTNAPADSPAAAVESWVTQILQKRYTEACLASAPAMAPGQDAQTVCDGPEAKKTLESLHEAWAKPGVKLPPQAKVKATGVAPQGDTATVTDTAISVDGRTLHELALIGATGNVESFSVSLELKKHNGTWHVGDLHIKF